MSESQQTAILVGDKNRSTIGDIIIDVIIEEPETFGNRIAQNPVSKRFTTHIEPKGEVHSIVASWFDVRHLERVLLTGYAAEQVEKVKALMGEVVTIATPSTVHSEVLIQDIMTLPTKNHQGKRSIRIKFIEARFAGIKTREVTPSDVSRYAASKKSNVGKKKGSEAATDSERDSSFSIFDGSVPLNIAKNAGWIE